MTIAVIAAYVQELNAALGDDAVFRAVYAQLSADKAMGQRDMAAIASGFFAPTGPSTPRSKSLQKIMRRHEALMEIQHASIGASTR